MDASASLLGYEGSLCHWGGCPSSDSEFYSISSPETVSPAPSMDFVFSPPSKRQSDLSSGSLSSGGFGHSDTAGFLARSPISGQSAARPIRTRSRSKNPSKQRQSASEKEKLRMRDLTKALHHLRTYLPASVAPVGQTLTKIETLRLTIRYIAHLSAQLGLRDQDQELGLGDQELAQRKGEDAGRRRGEECRGATQEILGYFQCTPAPTTAEGSWRANQEHRSSAFLSAHQQQQHQRQGGMAGTHATQNTRMDQYGPSVQMPIQNDTYGSGIGIDYLFQTTPSLQTTQSCQMYNRDFGYQLVPQEYWS